MHIGLGLATIVLLLGAVDDIRLWDQTDAFRLVTTIGLVNALLALAIARFDFWTASIGYQSVYWAFHFGLVGLVAVGVVNVGAMGAWVLNWLLSASANEAAVLAGIAAIAISIGVHTGDLLAKGGGESGRAKVNRSYDEVAAMLGAVLASVSVAIWFSIAVRAGGLQLLVGSYDQYLEATAGVGVVDYVWIGIGLGSVLLAMAPPSRSRRIGVAAVVSFAAVALPVGLRGEVLFPVVAAGVVKARRGSFLSARATAIIAACLLVVIGVIAAVRSVGLGGASSEQLNVSVWNGLAELGGSLHPVQKVVEWHDTGDDYLYGASYWAPFDRQLLGALPWRDRRPATEDERIMNILVAKRIGNIGFSPVAEAYRNFGRLGVAIVPFIIGFALSRIDRLPRGSDADLLAGALLLPLLINVRNDFIAVPVQVFLGCVVAYFCRVGSRYRRRSPARS